MFNGPSVLKLWPLLIGKPSNRLLLWASPRHKNLSRPSFASPGSLCLGSSWVHLLSYLSSPLDHDSTNSIVYINMSLVGEFCGAQMAPNCWNTSRQSQTWKNNMCFYHQWGFPVQFLLSQFWEICVKGMTRKNVKRDRGTAGWVMWIVNAKNPSDCWLRADPSDWGWTFWMAPEQITWRVAINEKNLLIWQSYCVYIYIYICIYIYINAPFKWRIYLLQVVIFQSYNMLQLSKGTSNMILDGSVWHCPSPLHLSAEASFTYKVPFTYLVPFTSQEWQGTK